MKRTVDLRGDKKFDRIALVISILLFLIILYPLYFVIIASFSNPTMVVNGDVVFWPKGINFEGYRRILAEDEIWLGYRNTIAYAIVGTMFCLLFTLPAAYALSRKDLKGRNAIMIFFVFTMYFSGGLIPAYLAIKSYGLLNTFWVLVVPGAVSAYNLIIVRSFFTSNIPTELLEAAQMDGCSNTRFFVQIVLPLSKAIISVISLYSVVGQWNQYMTSLIYANKPELISLQLVLRKILLQNKMLSGTAGLDMAKRQAIVDQMKYGIIIVSTLPVMCLWPFIQKYFTKGVMIGSIKG